MADQSAISAGAQGAATEAVVPAPPRRLDLIGKRNWFFLVSLIIIVPGILSMMTHGFSLGVDFVGGNQATVYFQHQVTLAEVQSAVTRLEGNSATVQETTGGAGAGGFVIRTPVLTPAQQTAFESNLAAQVAPINQGRSSYSQVGGSVAQNTVRNAFLAIILASIAILGYLAFRFRKVPGGWRSGLQFGGSALIALLHDVFVLTGIFSIIGRVFDEPVGQINSLFLTALLTVVGFSVHDTIVVFDRMRENLSTTRSLTFEQVANLSLMQTLNRSIITSFTVVIVLASLLIFGGASIQGFVLALLIGIVSGTYSSIFNATPILVVWRRLQPLR
ncbi:MAG: protein translocase subunit SecF [Candidatus Dormibacteraceae bacterium]